MDDHEQHDPVARAEALRALHTPSSPLVLVNVWDVMSARAVAAAGASAIATSSAAMAWALGALDGAGRAADGFFETVARISAAVAPLPVTVDIEAGFGSTPSQVAMTVRKVLAAGAVGVNLEDRLTVPGAGAGLHGIPEQQVRIRAARAAADAMGVPLVINARTDVFLAEVGEPGDRLRLSIERASAYLAAGADGVFVPGVSDAADIAALVDALPGPLNVLAGPSTPSLDELTALGVARVSTGSWPARALLGRLGRIAASVLAGATFDGLDEAVSYGDAQALAAGRPAPAPSNV